MKRAHTYALAATVLAVVALVASLVLGLGSDEAAPGRAPTSPLTGRPTERVRVEVLNASGTPGLAREATRALRDRGYDVVFFGNAPRSFSKDTSLVIDRAGREGLARQVAEALEVERVRSRPDTALLLEVTVVIGRDWAGIEKQAAAVPGDTAS